MIYYTKVWKYSLYIVTGEFLMYISKQKKYDTVEYVKHATILCRKTRWRRGAERGTGQWRGREGGKINTYLYRYKLFPEESVRNN